MLLTFLEGQNEFYNCNVSDKVERLQIQLNSLCNRMGVCNLSILYCEVDGAG